MKAIFNLFDFKFLFYANDNNPIHVHVYKGETRAKFTLSPVKLIENEGLEINDVQKIMKILRDNEEILAENWNKHFNNRT